MDMRRPIVTARTRVRRWEERDRDAFHRLNLDETVMRFFHMRRTREESDGVMDELNERLDRDGYSFLALDAGGSEAAVGILGMAIVKPVMPFAPGIEIGWRLLPDCWGKGYVTEAAAACLDRAFAEPDPVGEIVSFCNEENRASEAVMLRLGFSRAEDFDHPSVPVDTHPHLVRHRLYRLRREDFAPERTMRGD